EFASNSTRLTLGSLFANGIAPKLNCRWFVRGPAKLTTDIMKNSLINFIRDEQGQDLIEYTLLLAFVALASAALFIGAGNSVKGIWSLTNSQLEAANTSAS